MKMTVQNTNSEVVIIHRLKTRQDYDNGYYEQLAIGYNINSDCLELVVLSCGQGAGDNRVLADSDEYETLQPATLYEAANELDALLTDPAYEDIREYLFDLSNYVMDQALFLEKIQENAE